MKSESNLTTLPENPTKAQIRSHNDKMAKEGKAHDDIFMKILTLETAKKARDQLKEEFQGSERAKKCRG